jgi:hypothetical protein
MRYLLPALCLAVLLSGPLATPILTSASTPDYSGAVMVADGGDTMLEGIDWDDWLMLEGIDWDDWLMLDGIDWDDWLYGLFENRPEET